MPFVGQSNIDKQIENRTPRWRYIKMSTSYYYSTSSSHSQDEVIAFLSDGASYGLPGTRVEQIETHISVVFLIADRAYKLKRAVRFSYLDYSTTSNRERFCKSELELNQRTAPSIYLRVRPIYRSADGRLCFDHGTIVEWILEMRRFSQADLFDQLALCGRLTPHLMRDLTDVIVEFHSRAKPIHGHGGHSAIEQTIRDNYLNLVQYCPPLNQSQVEHVTIASMAQASAVAELLDTRRATGRVRRCHGDLHLRNICFFEGRPTIFDCIEFSDELACIDVLYDLAFLLMDLVQRDLIDLANIVFNRYLDLSAEIDGLPALSLFLSMRAAVRAHVQAALNHSRPSAKTASDAQSYLALADVFLRPGSACLIAIGGLSGVGKSSVAQALASGFSPAPGARVIRSDILRKRLFDYPPEAKLPDSAYTSEVTERVYRALDDQAKASLAAGYTTIVDATFLRQDERHRISACANLARLPFIGIWLEAPSAVLMARIDSRGKDASDADTDVLKQQLKMDPGPIEWKRIDAAHCLDEIVAEARFAIDSRRVSLKDVTH
jgi:aminoglycoside phosphotransferase family enzyme/predicted kinase